MRDLADVLGRKLTAIKPGLLRWLVIAVWALGLGSGAAVAGNLLTNGRFDTGIAPWASGAAPPKPYSHDAQDLTGWEPSGSLRLANSNPGFNPGAPLANVAPAIQTVEVLGGRTYAFRARYLIPSGQTSPGTAYAYVVTAPGPNCIGAVSFHTLPQGTTVGAVQSITGEITIPAHHQCAQVYLGAFKSQAGGTFAVLYDEVFFGTPCAAGPTTLCLNGARYEIRGTWQFPNGSVGPLRMQQLTNDTGYFYFNNPSNVEAVIKTLNACAGGQRYWVFAGGLTNVRVDLTVTDTETGARKSYANPLNKPFQPIQDTDAFATCP